MDVWPSAATDAARARIAGALAEAGARVPDIDVEIVDAIERSALGKHRLVVQA